MEKHQFVQTPLHDAAAAGHTALAMEIMNLMPSLGRKLNMEGFTPLHLAVGNWQGDTALALLKLDKQLLRVKGRCGLTSLHRAAATAQTLPQLELLAALLAECPEAMGEMNNRLQSAVHVALENDNEKAAGLIVNWLVIVARESDLSTRDVHGNTTLHVAARYCRDPELLKKLCKFVKVNKRNNYGETARDIAVHHRNCAAVDILKNAGATTWRGEEHSLPRAPKTTTTVQYLCEKHADKCAEKLMRAYYFLTKELTMEMRNAILVVAVLIATATYQGVLQPPGGVYSAEGNNNALSRLTAAPPPRSEHPPGRMVMGTTKYSYFMPTNTLAFISSTLIIIYVLPNRAFVMILQACLIFMCISYLLALNFISYYNSFSRILDIVCGCTLGVAFLSKLAYYFVKAYYNKDEWLLRGLGVILSNGRAWFRGPAFKKDGEKLSFITRMRKQYKLISRRVD
ncbi:hypothetical protein C2S52_008276 [Perilla frutescens var. hirtella]|nr:hypothetical protein C2S52_008276 [Perilla frutescens var. hirtella]